MAYGISVQLPLSLDVNDGAYTLNKDIKQSVKQNFKNLILTAPGERIMDPAFGVGIRNYLFENSDDFTSDDAKTSLTEEIDMANFFCLVQNYLVVYQKLIKNTKKDTFWVNTMKRLDDQIWYCESQKKNDKTRNILL